MPSPFDAGAWIRQDMEAHGGSAPSFLSDTREGANTGFGLFSTDPASGGILDTRGAFNPAFNGQTEHPVFEAETDALRQSLPALARRARRGDANAALAYQSFYGTLGSKKRLYDLAYSTGLNDRNAADVMNHVFETVTPEKFGSGTDQYRTIYSRYLARQAQSRGVNVSDLLSAEQTMDDAFRSAFLPALSAATGVTRAGGLKELYGASEGMMANASLFLKRGLADWEAKNGLRDDATRAAVMGRAAEYYAKALSNPSLRPLAGDARKIMETAAGDVGAGPKTDNLFSDYTRAVNLLDRGFISYTGTADGDVAAGYGVEGDKDGRTAAFWAVRDAYERAYGANVTAGRRARDFDSTTREQLTKDLVANLTDISPRASKKARFGNMVQSLARDIVESGETKGYVNFNELSRKYYKHVNLPEPEAVPEALAGREERKDLESFTTELVDWGISQRPVMRNRARRPGGFVVGAGYIPSSEPIMAQDQYDPEKVRAAVHERVTNANASDGADPWSARGNREEYRQGAKDRLNVLFMAEEVARRGVDLGGWTPNVEGDDEHVRGRSEANLRGMYSGLSDRIGAWLQDAEKSKAPNGDTTNLRGADLHNWHFLYNLKKGLDYLMKSGGDYDEDSYEGKRAKQYRDLFDTYAGADMSAARAAAQKAVDLDRSLSLPKLFMPKSKELRDEAAALAVLTEDIFADALNPALAVKAYNAFQRYAIDSTRLGIPILLAETRTSTPRRATFSPTATTSA